MRKPNKTQQNCSRPLDTMNAVGKLKDRPYLLCMLSLTIFFATMFALNKLDSVFHPHQPRFPTGILKLSSRPWKTFKKPKLKQPLVLVYNDFFRSKDWYSFWLGSKKVKTLGRCEVPCLFTWEKSDLKRADFVLVSLAGYHLYGGKPVV